MFKNYNHYVGYSSDDLVFGYTKRTNGQSDYPKNAFNMALYIGDNPDNVHRHQQLLSEEIGFERSDFVIPIQTHENKVYEVKKADAGTNVDALTNNIYGIDALYTYERNIVLGMNYADCTPIYVYSVANNFIGLVHAGWKGTRGNVLKNLLDHYDGDIDDLHVVIGVAINGDYYEVDDAVVNDSFLVAEIYYRPYDESYTRIQVLMNNGQEIIADYTTFGEKINYFNGMRESIGDNEGIIDLEVSNAFIPYNTEEARRVKRDMSSIPRHVPYIEDINESLDVIKKSLEKIETSTD